MAFGSNKDNKIFAEINITPLTDIFLVLLIIMMVVAPSFQNQDANVDVPVINNGVNIEEARVTVSVIKDGSMFVNGQQVNASDLTDSLIDAKDPELEGKQEVIVKADKNIKSAKIMDIMDAAQNAEYKKLIVAGEPLNKKEQKELQDNSQRKTVEIPAEDE